MFFCFFKQRTAYEMRISDWSSDVCSSDLGRVGDSLVVRRGTLGVSGRLGRSLGLDGLLVGDELARLGGGLGEVGDLLGLGGGSSEERRGGKESVSKCRSRLSPDHYNKHQRVHSTTQILQNIHISTN